MIAAELIAYNLRVRHTFKEKGGNYLDVKFQLHSQEPNTIFQCTDKIKENDCPKLLKTELPMTISLLRLRWYSTILVKPLILLLGLTGVQLQYRHIKWGRVRLLGLPKCHQYTM